MKRYAQKFSDDSKSAQRPKGQRILALVGVVFLLLMYLATLICAFIDSADTMIMFKVTILTTVLVPVLLWAYTLVYKLVAAQSRDLHFEAPAEDENNEEPEDGKEV